MYKTIAKSSSQSELAGCFIKTTDSPASSLTSEQKATLNRKGNVLFNEGEIDKARRIFITTGYSDGLSRVADFFMEQNKELEAFKLYWLAHNKRRYSLLIEKIAKTISLLCEKE